MKPNYGIDAPGLVRTFFAVAIVAMASLFLSAGTTWPAGWLGTIMRTLLAIVGIYTIGMGCFMVTYSRRIKQLDSERLLDLLDFSKIDQVLELGCGRGLMLIGAAKRMRKGKAVGIDLWVEQD